MQSVQVAPVEIYDTSAIPVVITPTNETDKLPKVFLSYQWGIQRQVKKLKNALEKDGYRCWMDIEQMGGGDTLLEKIEVGIRNAEVVILCLSDFYNKSKNCLLEANFAHRHEKKIIPLVFDRNLAGKNWPPESLGLILAGTLYTAFYQDDLGTDIDFLDVAFMDRPWSEKQYTELLKQLDRAFKNPIQRITTFCTPVQAGGALLLIISVILLLYFAYKFA